MNKKDRRTVITLCGSTRFEDLFNIVEHELTLAGFVVLSVGYFSHSDNDVKITDEMKQQLFAIHKQKIDMADSILVLDVDGYIGEDTKKDINFAENYKKHIEYYSKGHFEQLKSLRNIK